MAADPTLAPSVRFDVIDYADLTPAEDHWKLLGKGSFGCVWRAEYLGIPVAAKEILASNECASLSLIARSRDADLWPQMTVRVQRLD